MMKSRALALAMVSSTLVSAPARADGCNISNLLFGKVRIELIPHGSGRDFYETGIIFGNDFESKRFAYGRILGQIASSERDGSHRVSDVNQEVCGIIESNLRIDTQDTEYKAPEPVRLQKVGSGFAVLNGSGSIMGTIEGRLPK
ncbi:hypothetical protein [Methylorubrum extorquens]|uniref:Uncharacterized protein n=1 Tax=Methylorubrum extorquens (strain CM4 / NCIMB 13688) TaxID=440085 RepID=B7KRK7_METC4|nr:hypothetical protein [Methylorubrum extorquens]ACK85534.1 hypothetical protein Mchl_4760 [Methylorubrum extorquens CM4]